MIRLLAAYAATFIALHIYWDLAEAAQPGQQYADPLLPVLCCTALFGGPVWSAAGLVVALRRRGRAR